MKKILITLSVVALIIVLYIVWMNLQQPEQPTTQEPVSQEISLQENLNPLEEAWKKINLKTVIKKGETFDLKQEPEYKFCMEQSVNMCISQTVTQVVNRDKNPEVCEVLESPQQIETCKNNLYLQLATLEQDLDLCLNIADERTQRSCKNSIYRTQALTAWDEKLCEKIEVEIISEQSDEFWRLWFGLSVVSDIQNCQQDIQRDRERQEEFEQNNRENIL